MVYKIAYTVARQIADHAQDDYPNEVCGLLAGHGDHIYKAIPTKNIADNPLTEYLAEPYDQLQALKQLDAENLDWLGVYHSHPKSRPIISPTDIARATDPNLIHIIVSLQNAKPELKAWRINGHDSEAVDLIFDTQSPQNTAHEPLSNSQKLAIILSGIISVLILLTISFTLLPPAPEITPIP